MAQLLLDIPTWTLTRIFAMIAYLMLFMGLCLGMLYGYPTIKGKMKAKLYKIHTFCTNTGVLLALMHALVLIIDTFMPFSWQGLLIPFAAKNNPFLNGLGTIASYGFLFLILTSDFRKSLKKKMWHTIHIMAYPLFLIAFVHGYFLGTDSTNPIIGNFYFASFIIPTILFMIRLGLRSETNKRNNGLSRN